DQLFSELLYLLHHNAFNALDNIDNTLHSESDLTSVRQLIDMVVMLKDKTRGNLSDELDQIQTMMLSELESKYQQKLKISETNGSAKQ
ncbi:MAG: DUF1844 domain-containing protein, partial [Bacteroidota bacterium]|nr:DUF1844 domain-containing protein [Bacteroidota bacterium]